MSGPITPPLTVTEVDGAPSGRPITTIKVSNGDLTISGSTATIDTSGSGGSGTVTSITAGADSGSGTAITTSGTFTFTGGTGVTTSVSGTTVTIAADNNGDVTATGTPADNELAVWDSASSIEGDSNLTWDGSLLTVTGDVAIDGELKVNTITSEDTNADIDINPNGTGEVKISDAYYLPSAVTGDDDYVLTAQTDGTTAWAAGGGGGGATELSGLSDVLIDATNWSNGFLIQTNSGGSAPTTGTLSSASNNIGIGADVLSSITTADRCIVFGEESARGLLSGSDNIVIGSKAMHTAAGAGTGTQSMNIAIGTQTMGNIQNGSKENIAIGYQALGPSNALSGEGNTAIGFYSGRVTSGNNNLMLGTGSGNITTGSNNIIIGKAAADDATADDQLVISSGDATPIWIKGDSTGALTINEAYTLPSAVTGGDGYYLSADTDGTTQWVAGGGSGTVTVGTYAGSNNLAYFSGATEISNTNNISINAAAGSADFYGSVEAGKVKIGTDTNKNTIETSSAQDLVLRTNAGTNSGKLTLTDGTDGDISLTPDGSGAVEICAAYKLPTAVTGTNNFYLRAQTDGTTAWAAQSGGPTFYGPPESYMAIGDKMVRLEQCQPIPSSSATSATISTDYPLYYPFISPTSGDVDTVTVRTTGTVASQNMLVAFYSNDDDNDAPETQIGGTTTISLASSTEPNNSPASTVSLVRGTMYWVGYVQSNSGASDPVMWVVNDGALPYNASISQASRNALRESTNSNSLPATAPTSGYTGEYSRKMIIGLVML